MTAATSSSSIDASSSASLLITSPVSLFTLVATRLLKSWNCTSLFWVFIAPLVSSLSRPGNNLVMLLNCDYCLLSPKLTLLHQKNGLKKIPYLFQGHFRGVQQYLPSWWKIWSQINRYSGTKKFVSWRKFVPAGTARNWSFVLRHAWFSR